MPTKIRIGGALIVGLVIVAGAFYMRSHATDAAESGVSAVSGGVAARTYIGSEDRDGNGSSDWEDELREMTLRANPDATPYVEPTGTAEAEPKTLTEQFARTFFETYVRDNAGGKMDQNRMSGFLDASLGSLEQEARDTLYTKRDILIGDNSLELSRTYGNEVMAAITRHSFASENEIDIFERAVQSNSKTELSKLTNIADGYDAILADTLKLTAPTELAVEHLALVNAYLAIRNDIRAMENAFDDPLYALVRVKRYPDDTEALRVSLRSIYSYLDKHGVRFADDEPGAGGAWFLTQ